MMREKEKKRKCKR